MPRITFQAATTTTDTVLSAYDVLLDDRSIAIVVKIRDRHDVNRLSGRQRGNARMVTGTRWEVVRPQTIRSSAFARYRTRHDAVLEHLVNSGRMTREEARKALTA